MPNRNLTQRWVKLKELDEKTREVKVIQFKNFIIFLPGPVSTFDFIGAESRVSLKKALCNELPNRGHTSYF